VVADAHEADHLVDLDGQPVKPKHTQEEIARCKPELLQRRRRGGTGGLERRRGKDRGSTP
jgi:hypothetical protein